MDFHNGKSNAKQPTRFLANSTPDFSTYFASPWLPGRTHVPDNVAQQFLHQQQRRRFAEMVRAPFEPNPSTPSRFPRKVGQGVHCEVESERHEEKYRAVIEGTTPQ